MQDLISNNVVRMILMRAHKYDYVLLNPSTSDSWIHGIGMAVNAALLRQVEMAGDSERRKRYELTDLGRAIAECCLYYELRLHEQQQKMQTERDKYNEEIAQKILEVLDVDVRNWR